MKSGARGAPARPARAAEIRLLAAKRREELSSARLPPELGQEHSAYLARSLHTRAA